MIINDISHIFCNISGIFLLAISPIVVGRVQYSRSGHNLLTIPDDIPENTTYLDLSHNSLFELETRSFNNVHACEYLNLSFNHLRFVHEGDFQGLHNLKVLNISFNHLFEFSINEIQDLNSLAILDLSNNRLRHLRGGSLFNLPEVERIILDDNKLFSINRYAFFPNGNFTSHKRKIVSLRSNSFLCIAEWLSEAASEGYIQLVHDTHSCKSFGKSFI